MNNNKEKVKLNDELLGKISGGAAGFMGEEIPDYGLCPRCSSYSMVIHIDAGFFECLGCKIAFDTEGRIWEA